MDRKTLYLLLLLLSSSAPAHAQVPFLPPEIIVYTDRQTYNAGEEVVILGIAVNEDFRPVAGVEVFITVLDPNNQIILEAEARTNQSGVFAASLRLNQAADEGEYLITVDDAEGEFTSGSRAFIVCNICPTKPQIVVVTTTLPGPTVTTTRIITATVLTTQQRTTTVSTTVVAEAAPMGDVLSIVFIAVLLAIFGFIILYSRKL
ncbi:MAG: MG2 domain-containing protein [Candidatus Caldarchaeum sp.]|nr:MG2 domain-containing protein [Candidatus Caldarchaeum sp.]MCS7137639.1 MG2 domain-containing protein [Candidatus Caldarchaeum sp.]MDW7978748.1 MG2 domain-containing protein [Candidatus Caldarchaeum sp.]MDW8359143.1 MG2 domain-containing protein [Candidatus Caldarchaeum sp.]